MIKINSADETIIKKKLSFFSIFSTMFLLIVHSGKGLVTNRLLWTMKFNDHQNVEQKPFWPKNIIQGSHSQKLFSSKLTNGQNKLECLQFAQRQDFFSQV
jgi:hypothetical protein